MGYELGRLLVVVMAWQVGCMCLRSAERRRRGRGPMVLGWIKFWLLFMGCGLHGVVLLRGACCC
jgi:hypothetical protein